MLVLPQGQRRAPQRSRGCLIQLLEMQSLLQHVHPPPATELPGQEINSLKRIPVADRAQRFPLTAVTGLVTNKGTSPSPDRITWRKPREHIPLHNLYIYIYVCISYIYKFYLCIHWYKYARPHTHKHTPVTQSTEHTHTHTYRNILNYAELKSKTIIKKSLAGLKIELKNYSKCL